MPRRSKRNCQENPYENGVHSVDLKDLAKNALESYFKNKNWFVGGPIPERYLLSEESIKMVLRTPFDDPTFDFIHENCLSNEIAPRWYKERGVPWSVTFLIQMLKEIKSLGIPKEFQPGLVLLYFKFCKGVKIPSILIN